MKERNGRIWKLETRENHLINWGKCIAYCPSPSNEWGGDCPSVKRVSGLLLGYGSSWHRSLQWTKLGLYRLNVWYILASCWSHYCIAIRGGRVPLLFSKCNQGKPSKSQRPWEGRFVPALTPDPRVSRKALAASSKLRNLQKVREIKLKDPVRKKKLILNVRGMTKNCWDWNFYGDVVILFDYWWLFF